MAVPSALTIKMVSGSMAKVHLVEVKPVKKILKELWPSGVVGVDVRITPYVDGNLRVCSQGIFNN